MSRRHIKALLGGSKYRWRRVSRFLLRKKRTRNNQEKRFFLLLLTCLGWSVAAFGLVFNVVDIKSTFPSYVLKRAVRTNQDLVL